MDTLEFHEIIERYRSFDFSDPAIEEFLEALDNHFDPDTATELVTGMANLLTESNLGNTKESIVRLGYLITCVASKLPD